MARSCPRRKRGNTTELDVIDPAAFLAIAAQQHKLRADRRARTAIFQLFFRPADFNGARANCPFSGPVWTNLSVGIIGCDLTHRRLRAS